VEHALATIGHALNPDLLGDSRSITSQPIEEVILQIEHVQELGESGSVLSILFISLDQQQLSDGSLSLTDNQARILDY
jgi:hypothetical protein